MQITTVVKVNAAEGPFKLMGEPVKAFHSEDLAQIFCVSQNTAQVEFYYLYYTLEVE